MSDSWLTFNGIDGATGQYLLPPLSPDDIVRLAQGQSVDPGHLAELRQRWQAVSEAHFGAVEGIDTSNLAEAGWGVVFAHDADPAIREALSELLEHRRRQAAQQNERFYREFSGPNGYRPGESKQAFLARHGAGPGPADPIKVPYYLLIVGDPETIPYRFQNQLDVQYAVGRLHFETLDEYASYARTVVAAETGRLTVARAATFFGARNPDDRATELSHAHLVGPLARSLSAEYPDWQVRSVLADEATRANLSRVLGGDQTPALVFTASHGMGFPKDDPRQLIHQGALLCQDWPGPRRWRQAIPDRFYLSADDIGDDARVGGAIVFAFACYGAGTPRLDEFAVGAGQARAEIAARAFVSRLPQRLLGHPRGGALAVVGHVERTWGCSFVWQRAGEQLGVFESALRQLCDGRPVGSALEYFNKRYAELSSDLAVELEEIKFGRTPDALGLSGLWTSNNDARSYVILGDPAVRLPLSDSLAAPPPTAAAQPLGATVMSTRTPPPPPGDEPSAPGNSSRTNSSPADSSPADSSPMNSRSDAPAFASDAPQSPSDGPASTDESDAASEPLPFSADVIAACERRYSAMDATRGGALESFGVSAVGQNPPDAVKRRLMRLGFTPEQADQACARMTGAALESVSFGTVGPTPSEEAVTAADVGLERILGGNDLLNVAFLKAGSQRARTVARIVIKNSPTRQLGHGTGFVVWPGLILTNNHVIKSSDLARFSRVQFNYEDDALGVRQTPIEFALDPDRFFVTNPGLDFSLIAINERSVDGDVALTSFGWNRLHSEPDEILIGESVNIIQHPNGEPKQLALRENEVIGMPEEQFLHYRTDTASGSSGSPVYNDQWELVALHHSGVPRRDEQGRILATDGRLWTTTMGEHRIDWIANEGVRIAAIAAALRDVRLSPEQGRLRDQSLAPPAPGEDEASATSVAAEASRPRDSSPRRAAVLSPAAVAGALADALGDKTIPQASLTTTAAATTVADATSITLDIPLQVTVHVKTSGIVAHANLAAAASAAASGASSVAMKVPVPRGVFDGGVFDGGGDASDAGDVEDEAVSIDADYRNRRGYDPGFLGNGQRRVPLPTLSDALRKKAAVNQQAASNRDPLELTYHHYSVVMNKKRRLAFFAAVNIDGRKISSVPRDRDKWYFDPRISRNEQSGSSIYQRNPLDKGHLVRRLDAAWGDDPVMARTASDDTFHWTNCTPQHAEFNRNKTTWAGLEDYVLKNADVEDLKVSVFNGPVFDESDPPYRGVNLPREYWKIVVMVKKSGQLSATAYLLSQQALIQGLEEAFAFGQYKTFQVPVHRIEALTGLDFGPLAASDPFAGDATESLESATLLEIATFDDLQL